MEDTKKCLAGCDETDQLHNLYIDSIYGKLFVDLVGIEVRFCNLLFCFQILSLILPRYLRPATYASNVESQ